MTLGGVTINSCLPHGDKQVHMHVFLDSGAQHHACPIKYRGQKVPLPDPRIHTASGARLQHDGGRLVTYKLPQGRTIRVLFHGCGVQKPSSLLFVPLSRGTGVILAQTHVHRSSLTRSSPNTAKHSCTKKRVCSLSKKMLMAPLVTTGVSDDVAQELQMPISPQALDDVEEPMPSRPATL